MNSKSSALLQLSAVWSLIEDRYGVIREMSRFHSSSLHVPIKKPFLKSEISHFSYEREAILTSVRAFERGQIDFNGLFPPEIMTYESNIAYTMRFMIDTKVSYLVIR
jgi:hypothetical protein